MSLVQSREEQMQADTEMKEAATYPYKRCIELIHEDATTGIDAAVLMGGKAGRVMQAQWRLNRINDAINRYELREELDL